MPPRIAYWTSSFEPEMEAIASEVALLRRHFPVSVVWGLSHKHWVLLSWKRGYCLNRRLHLLFRAATRILEPVFDLNHVFGSLGDWFYLHGVRKRPLILTMATMNPVINKPMLERVDRFVVEYPGAIDDLRRLGIEEMRISQIFPPVDLERFSPGGTPDGPFTALFASSPEAEEWLDARGVPQILDAAMLRPKMRFRLLWRPWGNSAARVRQWIAERGLTNVEMVVKCFDDMANEYNKAHVTLTPFSDMIRSKAAPNSLVESLACGRPVVTTAAVGLSEFIREGGAGITCAATGEALAENLDRLATEWNSYSCRARRLAETWFGVERFVGQHQKLYSEVLSK
jgi:glycosyltransferase involved in cell wall biosynthesis